MKSTIFTAGALGAFLALSSFAGAGPALASTTALTQSEGRPMIGVLLEAGGGSPVIESVVPGSPAEAAGLKSGDVIVSVGDTKTDSLEALRGKLGGLSIGDTVEITVQRGDDTEAVSLSLADSSKLGLPEEPIEIIEEIAPTKVEGKEAKQGKILAKVKESKAPKAAKQAKKAKPAKKAKKQAWVIDKKDDNVTWEHVSKGHGAGGDLGGIMTLRGPDGKVMKLDSPEAHDSRVILELLATDGEALQLKGKDGQQHQFIIGSGGGAPIKVKNQKHGNVKVGTIPGYRFEILEDGSELITEFKGADCNGDCCDAAVVADENCCQSAESSECEIEIECEEITECEEISECDAAAQCEAIAECVEIAECDSSSCCEAATECPALSGCEGVSECDSGGNENLDTFFFDINDSKAHGKVSYGIMVDGDSAHHDQIIAKLQKSGLENKAIKDVVLQLKAAHGNGKAGGGKWVTGAHGQPHVMKFSQGKGFQSGGNHDIYINKTQKIGGGANEWHGFDVEAHGHGDNGHGAHGHGHGDNDGGHGIHGHGDSGNPHGAHGQWGMDLGEGDFQLHDMDSHGQWDMSSSDGGHKRVIRVRSNGADGQKASMDVHARVLKELKAAGVSGKVLKQTMAKLEKAGVHPQQKSFAWGTDAGGRVGIAPKFVTKGGSSPNVFQWHTSSDSDRAPKFELHKEHGATEVQRIREELKALRAELRELRASLKRRRR